jgi:peroxiredoxin
MPASPAAPAVGAKAPDFTLPDTNNRPVTLAQLLAAPGSKGVILVFYRGYW